MGKRLITGDSMFYEIDKNRLSGTKPNWVKVRIFARSHHRCHERLPETVFKTLTSKHKFTPWFK